MVLDEVTITRAILEAHMKALLGSLDLDVAVVGGGPAGLTCAAIVAASGKRCAVFEKKLSVGGGMWGGGMMFPRIVVQEEARRLLDHFGIRYQAVAGSYYVASSVETVAKLTAAACNNGVEFFNLTSVEDVMIKEDGRLSGIVINWTAVEISHLHVDPLTIRCNYTVDATGHDAVIAKLVEKKSGLIQVRGERSMWADRAESQILHHTKEVYPGLVVSGMAANAVAGEHRMGPIFGGMLLSGERAARIITSARD